MPRHLQQTRYPRIATSAGGFHKPRTLSHKAGRDETEVWSVLVEGRTSAINAQQRVARWRLVSAGLEDRTRWGATRFCPSAALVAGIGMRICGKMKGGSDALPGRVFPNGVRTPRGAARADRAPSPFTVIGSPACTVGPDWRDILNKTL